VHTSHTHTYIVLSMEQCTKPGHSLLVLCWCALLLQCEFLNPGGSVKDRAALYIIKVQYSIPLHSRPPSFLVG